MIERLSLDTYKIHGEGNVYLLFRKGEWLVIDTSDITDREYITREIERIVPIGKIKKVLLTHFHYDHSGNANVFYNAEIYASPEEIKNYSENSYQFFFAPVLETTNKSLSNAKALREEINGLKVIKVPGHTEGSVAFVDEENHFLFSGDTVFEEAIGRSDLPTGNPEKIILSVKHLKILIDQLELRLCPGHNYEQEKI